MKKALLFILLFLSCPLVCSAQLYAMRNVVPDAYNFWLYLPNGYKDCRAERLQAKSKQDKSIPAPLPIVIFLHGRSLSGTDLNKVRNYGTLEALSGGRKINAIVLAPQVKMGDWWRPNRVMNIVKWVSENYDVDTSRIYVLGMSLGGYGAMDFAAAYPKETAAAMALCGGSTRKNADLGRLSEVPLWIMHGTADQAVPVSESRRVVKAIKAVNANAPRLRYDEFAGVGHSLLARVFYTGEAYQWLFKHSTADASRKVDRTVQIPLSRISSQPYRGLKFGSVQLKVVEKSAPFTNPKPVVATKSASKSSSASSVKDSSNSQYHTIQSGDTLYGLARTYKTTVKQLCEWNDITETTLLQINKKLRVK
jgi:LysM repeat protein/pimeloyl-ACP methyl ester carboxylesterase